MYKYRILETKHSFSPQFKRIVIGEDFGEMWSSIYPYNVDTYEEALNIITQAKQRDEDNKIIKVHEV